MRVASVFSWIVISVAVVSVSALVASVERSKDPTIPSVAPVWTARFEQSVRWQQAHPLGPLVVATPGGLHGVDPSSGKIAWSHTGLEEVLEDSFEPIPGTTLVAVSTGKLRDRTLVLDAADGHLVFDSRAAGIANILERTVLFESGGLLILGQEREDPTVKLFLADIRTGQIRWSNTEILGKMSAGMQKLAGVLARLAQAAAPPQSESAIRPLEVGPDAVVLASRGSLLKLSSATGESMWRVPNRDGDGPAQLFLAPDRAGLIVVGTEVRGQGTSTNGAEPVQTLFSAYRLTDGSPVWPKAIKVKGPLNPPVLLDAGAILSPGGAVKGNIKFVEYATGKPTWGKDGKGIDSDGGIVDWQSTDQGVVVTTGYDSAWTNQGTAYFLNVLDVRAGAFRFPESLKVRGRILSTAVVPKGVLYVTTHEVNVFDPKTGGSLVGRAVVSDALVTADAGAVLYAFAAEDGALWRIDKREASATRLNPDKLVLEGDDVPRGLEASGDRVTLLGAQNVAAFDLDGKLLFHRYYPAPRQPGWVRALLIAQSVRAGMAAAQAGMASAALAQYASTREDGKLDRELGEELSLGYARLAQGAAGISGDYARLARQRFEASVAARDFQFMMVQLDRGYGIAQVDKADGTIRGIIPIGKDKAPIYQVDDVAERVFYSPTEHEIIGYAF
jgi:PQQ-like domain